MVTGYMVTGPSIRWLQGPQSIRWLQGPQSIRWLQGPQSRGYRALNLSGGYRALNQVVTGPSITWLQGPQSRGYRALNCKVYSKAAHMCVYRVLYLERDGHSFQGGGKGGMICTTTESTIIILFNFNIPNE